MREGDSIPELTAIRVGDLGPARTSEHAPLAPLAIMAEATRKLGGRKAWRVFDLVRAQRGKGADEWPDWCHCPMSYGCDALVIGGVVKPAKVIGDMTILSAEEAQTAAVICALAAWRPTQGVYRFDPTLMEELSRTSLSGDLPTDVLFHLPEWCVYVEWEEEGDHCGFWALLDWHPSTANTLLRIIPVVDGLAAGSVEIALGGSLQEGLEKAFQVGEKYGRMAGLEPPQRKWTKSLVSPLVSAVLYLCTDKPDLRDASGGSRMPARIRRQGPIHSAQKPVIWETGWRMGSALRRARATAGEEQEAAPQLGSRRRGHIRRAHWHTYWVGSVERGDRRRQLRWLPPIAVALELEDGAAPFATVRPVRDEER